MSDRRVTASRGAPAGFLRVPRALLGPDSFLHPRKTRKPADRTFAVMHLASLFRFRPDPARGLDVGEVRISERDLARLWRWDRSRVQRLLQFLESIRQIERLDVSPDGQRIRCIDPEWGFAESSVAVTLAPARGEEGAWDPPPDRPDPGMFLSSVGSGPMSDPPSNGRSTPPIQGIDPGYSCRENGFRPRGDPPSRAMESIHRVEEGPRENGKRETGAVGVSGTPPAASLRDIVTALEDADYSMLEAAGLIPGWNRKWFEAGMDCIRASDLLDTGMESGEEIVATVLRDLARKGGWVASSRFRTFLESAIRIRVSGMGYQGEDEIEAIRRAFPFKGEGS